jgi:YgiT-type zinc finger domain-containing protein
MNRRDLNENVREFADRRSDMTRAEGRIYTEGHHGDISTIEEVDVLECPDCGELGILDKRRMSCCEVHGVEVSR